MTQITQSVGKGGMNLPVDVNYVQRLLNKKMAGTSHLMTPLVVDGDCGNKTKTAIHNYQRYFLNFAHPDSLISPGKTTITKLMNGIPTKELTKMWNDAVVEENKGIITSGGRIANANQTNKPLPAEIIPKPGYTVPAASPGKYSFPLPVAPTSDYHTGGRKFGAERNGRKHAACDLIAAAGTPVCAIADGVILKGPYYFYNGSYALEVVHDDILVRYGEIAPTAAVNSKLKILSEIKAGAKVSKGQLIGYITRMTGGSSMLHFECYSNPSLPGPLTDRSKNGGKFKRRSDLMDPTNLLDGCKSSLPSNPGKLDTEILKQVIEYGHARAK